MGMACNACGQVDSPDRHAGGGACGRVTHRNGMRSRSCKIILLTCLREIRIEPFTPTLFKTVRMPLHQCLNPSNGAKFK